MGYHPFLYIFVEQDGKGSQLFQVFLKWILWGGKI